MSKEEASCPKPINLPTPEPCDERPKENSSFLHMASEEDQKLVQKILEVLQNHNGHFRRLSWTNSWREESEQSVSSSSSSSQHHQNLDASSKRPRKRCRRVSFHNVTQVRYVPHELTDYGLPMMTAIPGTGNGTSNAESEWNNRPHTGWFNKYIGAEDRPRWWSYECEVGQSDDNKDDSTEESDEAEVTGREEFYLSSSSATNIESPRDRLVKRRKRSRIDAFQQGRPASPLSA
eukprot:CAMPEP_0167761266 /NCGR_PEP_ID=MMETSP0110_2-20121227/12072_1 /TAXON_ID=629695 /ORGANISM="Gymnochlora sp., Strain CCMP2014" /LENGTH=233 /DNA_ID=CAMNT_0007647921 /DNA_START=234 /DNA_END=935 /DNA_ORIENTATION=+